VPFVWKWPGHIPAGVVSDTPICSIDLYPTFLDLAGGKAREGYKLDGVSIAPHLTSGGKTAVDRDAIYWHFPGYLGAGDDHWRTTPVGAIRSGDYKLLEFFEDGKLELYNLKDDPSQEHDLAASQPEVAKELHEKLVAWRESVGAKMPTKNMDRKPPGKASKGHRHKKAAEDDE
jgi:arylsulfatase A-like enzyme